MVATASRPSRKARRALVVLGGVLASLAAPAIASAHPLGNFTVNTSATVVVRPAELVVHYVVDMAEIPAFQERAAIDVDGDGSLAPAELTAYTDESCRAVGNGLRVRVDGKAARLAVGATDVSLSEGQAGLSTLRLTCSLRSSFAGAGVHELRVADGNHADRIGWREIVAVGDGTTLDRSDVPGSSPSDELRSYPRDGTTSDVRTASVAFRAGGPALAAAPATGVRTAPDGGILGSFVARDLSAGLVALMIAAAFGVGAVHALAPGHGKSLIGVSLLGTGGTLRQAAGIGLAVSVMHTASVLALGLLVLSAERFVDPERVYPWLGLASGLVALGLGAVLLVSRIHHMAEHRRHRHAHPHADRPLSRRGLLALAFSGGILPSPTALVVLLGSASIGRTALGLAMIAAFSVGLAASLVGVGALAIRARGVAQRRFPERVMRLSPVVSAAAIAVIGVVLTARGVLTL
jgi:ABC-type nickel/cobalt efflux system permease component RcnA